MKYKTRKRKGQKVHAARFTISFILSRSPPGGKKTILEVEEITCYKLARDKMPVTMMVKVIEGLLGTHLEYD